MWHKIWDTATSFHQRYIRPVWIRVHYSKLQEVIDDDGEIEEELYINSEDRPHITAKSQVVRYGSTSCKFTNKSTPFPTSLEHEEFDQVDTGFYRPTITLPVLETAHQNGDISNSPTDPAFNGSSSCLKNSVTDFKHAIQFPTKRPPYRLVQEEADRIEIISIDNSSATSSKRRDSDEDYKKINHLLHQTNSSQNNVEEILQSSSVVTKKSKSRRKKIKKKLGRSARVSMHFLKEAFILGFTPPAPCLYFTGP